MRSPIDRQVSALVSVALNRAHLQAERRVNESEQIETLTTKAKTVAGWTFAAFRAWRARELP